MLDPWIIEEIRRREEEERRRGEQPVVELPMEAPRRPEERGGMGEGGARPGEKRGVEIVDFTI